MERRFHFSPVIVIIPIIFISLFSTSNNAVAFDPIRVIYLEPTDTPLPPDAQVSALVKTVNYKTVPRVQVPGCLDGDTTSYPVQPIRIPGFKALDIIIVSQTDPLPKGTFLQLLAITQCTDGNQLYNKVDASTVPGPGDK